MKKTTLLLLCILGASTVFAQKENSFLKTVSDVKLSGYGMLQYNAENKNAEKSNSFNIRIARVSLEGRILNDFYWKTQLQIQGNTSTLKDSPRLVDYFMEWQKYSFFKVKFGQFKRPFTYENPMNPIDQGFYSYSQNVSKLAGFADRTGEQASNGRDFGLQLQGDFLKNSNGRNLLHYQVGVFNGQGLNMKDADNRKDIIGGAWIMPLKGLRIGGFGWTGSYAKDGISLEKNRYAISAEYAANDWTVRSEYIHSQGKAFGTDNNGNTTVKNGDKADGFYALAIAPILKNKVHVKGRYNLYRDQATWESANTQYEIGTDYMFSKNLQISAEYGYTYNRAATNRKEGNFIDVELNFKF